MLLPPLPMPCLCPADCRLLIVDRIEAGHQAALEFEQREAWRQERIQQQQQQQHQAADAGAAAAQTTAEGAGGGSPGVDEGQQAGSPPQPQQSWQGACCTYRCQLCTSLLRVNLLLSSSALLIN